MAIAHPKIHPTFKLLAQQHKSPSPTQTSVPLAPRSTVSAIKCRTQTAHTRCRAVTKDDSLSSIITELERDQVEDAPDRPRPHGQLPAEQLADRWPEIHGRDNWAGLLDPMDPLLRGELIRYGEFAQASYDAFDYDPFSRYCGSCKYPRRKFFSSLAMEATDYEVTRYLYATSNINLPNFVTRTRGDRTWSERANWIGYVAVSGEAATARLGRRDIVVAWRGTVTKLEWVADLMDFLRPVSDEGIPCPDRAVKVESGFIDLYTDKDPTCRFCKFSAREQVLTEVKRLVEIHTKAGETVSITVTGHSLGSALAMVSAYDMVETGVDAGVASTCVVSFGGPRVGNGRFKKRFEELGVKALRVVNVHDSVPKVPGVLFNEHVPVVVQKQGRSQDSKLPGAGRRLYTKR